MQFRWMAILGLALAMTGQQADAARGDRGPVARPNPSRAALPSLSSRPPTTRSATTRSAQPISTARGGHAPRAASARAMAGATRDRGTITSRGRNELGSRDRNVRVAMRGLAGRHGAQQHAGPARGGFSRAGYHSAVLRGPSSRFTSMSACSTQRGGRVCGGTRTVAMRWSGGLSPAAGNQSSCPDGTMATMAVGHENVVRCVPM